MSKRLKFAVLAVLTVCMIVSACGCGRQGKQVEINEELINKLPDKGTFSQEVLDEIKKAYEVTNADNVPQTDGVIAWWDDYPRFAQGNSRTLEKLKAEVDATGSRNDEGRGAYARMVDSLSGIPALDLLHENGYRGGAWMETQGTSTMFIMALHQNEDGSFEMDPASGAAKLKGWFWGWKSTNPDVNKDANYIVWSGVHSFVNNEEWAYPYVLSEYPEISTPTYPDGTPAVGYFEGGDRTTPALAVFYDSACAKDLFGNYIHYERIEEPSADYPYAGEFYDGIRKTTFKVAYLNLPKDTADPFWIEYAKSSIDFWVSQGVDYFWCDNWNGWDSISNTPIYTAFGDWSEYRFKQYLKDHPEVGVKDPDNFSVTDYIIKKAQEINPDSIYTYINDPVYASPEWRNDPVWMAYLCFKRQMNLEYNKAYYTAVKEASLKYRGDPNAVAVCGNDFPYMTFGAFDGDYLDMISTEYGTSYSAATGFHTSGDAPNNYSGHMFTLVADTVRSHNALIWYYANKYPYTNTSGKVYGYEALAHNCVLHGAYSGTEKSILDVNTTIEKMKESFSDRREYAGIGVLYSPETETSFLSPMQFSCGAENPHDISYMGWCSAFDELNVPYKSIQMSRLAERIDSVELLIVPEVSSISDENIELIRKFVENGGTLIVTGEECGLYDSMDNCFLKRKKAELTEFAKNFKNKKKDKGHVIYMKDDPCFNYFIDAKDSDFEDMYEEHLADIEKMINGWYSDGYVQKYLEMVNIGPEASLVTTLNYSYSKQTFFIDLVNMQYDHESDVLIPMPEKTVVKARVPSMLWGKGYSVYLYTNGSEEMVELTEGEDFTVYGPYITVNVPQFETYATVVIR